VRQFATDGVLVHRGLHCSGSCKRDSTFCPNFWQRAIASSQLYGAYAKITPAALHCGKFIHRPCGDAEAAGYNPEFKASDFVRAGDGSARPFAKALR
jgi:hypothetical protein